MTEQEFIADYCERSRMTETELREFLVPMRCACEYPGCRGWAMVTNDPELIEEHRRLYAQEPSHD